MSDETTAPPATPPAATPTLAPPVINTKADAKQLAAAIDSAAKAVEKPVAAAAKPADAKPWVNPFVARKAAAKPAAAPAPTAPAAPAPKVDPLARLAELETLHKATSESLARRESVLKARVAQDLAALPEHVRVAVERDAGGDLDATMRLITLMHTVGAAKPIIPTGATTAPPPPATSAATNPDDAVLSEYESLKGRAPILANAFRLAHSAEIARAEKRRASAS